MRILGWVVGEVAGKEAHDIVRVTRRELLYSSAQCDSDYCKIAGAVL